MTKHVASMFGSAARPKISGASCPTLKKWASAQEDEVVWYRDKFTGKTMDRPGWNRLMAAVSAGNVSKVVVWRLDRLGRTAKGLTALFDDLCNKKVGLFSLRTSLDLSTPAGRLMANVLASVAAYEPKSELNGSSQDKPQHGGEVKPRADLKKGG